ncbi:thiamine pyrophosphate-dependent enzyme [Kocuria rhizophila]|nr:thiamine pyrophosphate-dependent enzyme [Kocuria rhizophila]
MTGDGGFLLACRARHRRAARAEPASRWCSTTRPLATSQADQVRIYGHGSATELANPDFVALAESFGALACATSRTARTAMTEAIAARRPTVIEVPMPLSLSREPPGSSSCPRAARRPRSRRTALSARQR